MTSSPNPCSSFRFPAEVIQHAVWLYRLQAAGLLERRPHDQDRRVHSLIFTSQGRALQAPLDTAMDQLNDEVAREMGGRAAALWASLRRLGEARR